MIYFDVSRSSSATHKSGLMRVTSRLVQEAGARVRPVSLLGAGVPPLAGAASGGLGGDDWWLTTELFSEGEAPGMWEFLGVRPCRMAAVYYDAIPLKLPHVTWPQSVARHAEYMKMLSRFDRVFAISEASREELLGFWRWQELTPRAEVETLTLGADFGGERRREPEPQGSKSLLCVGILEPRKNQLFLLEVCQRLWADGLPFELHIVGRVNPHFGAPVVAEIKAVARKWPCLHYHAAVTDATVAALYAKASASVFPTLAEGCGLPLVESLWLGVPCVCSDLPVLRENADGGGCVAVAKNDVDAWVAALKRLLTDDVHRARLRHEAGTRTLPTWAESARSLLDRLG